MPLTFLDFDVNPSQLGSVIGKSRTLAWPVEMYRITLPQFDGTQPSLNPFETLLLKLLETGNYTVGGSSCEELLVRDTCLKKELIHGVLLRLRDKEFLDSYNKITEKYRLAQAEAKDQENRPCVTAAIFREMAGGKVLPYINLLDDENPLRKKEEEEGNLYKKIMSGEGFKGQVPTPRDVLLALRNMKKRSRMYSDDFQMPAVHQISIMSQPEKYFLKCPIGIQFTDGEYRIADPFGTGISLVLEQVFENILGEDKRLADWLMKWKEKLIQTATSDLNESNQKAPYESRACWRKYPRLIPMLRHAPNKYRKIGQIYGAVEWAFYYYCKQFPVEQVLNELKMRSSSQHAKILKEIATKNFGFQLQNFEFRSILPGKILDFQEGKAEMVPDVSIALMLDSTNPQNPHFSEIAAKYPDFFIRLKALQNVRNQSLHQTGTKDGDFEQPEDAFMQEVVHILLPDVCFAPPSENEINQEFISDENLEARTSLQSEFGISTFNRMGEDLQTRLIGAERTILPGDTKDITGFIADVAAAIQGMLTNFCMLQIPPKIRDEEFLQKAEAKAQNAGLGTLPARIASTRTSRIRDMLQGQKATLGACVIAFLLMADEEKLEDFAQILPDFLDDVAKIIVKREHGNTVVEMAADELASFRKKSYLIIKTLMEV